MEFNSNCTMPLDLNIAISLSKIIGNSVNFWINREKNYREDLKSGK